MSTDKELIIVLEAKVEQATEAYTTALMNNSPSLQYYEDELVRLVTELNALKMKRQN